MISAFQSREFGFGMKINEEQLADINRYREGKEYIDKDAAKSKRGSTKKQHLPQVHLFWNLNMVQMQRDIGCMSTWCSK